MKVLGKNDLSVVAGGQNCGCWWNGVMGHLTMWATFNFPNINQCQQKCCKTENKTARFWYFYNKEKYDC